MGGPGVATSGISRPRPDRVPYGGWRACAASEPSDSPVERLELPPLRAVRRRGAAAEIRRRPTHVGRQNDSPEPPGISTPRAWRPGQHGLELAAALLRIDLEAVDLFGGTQVAESPTAPLVCGDPRRVA